MNTAQVIIIGDARTNAAARFETLATMFSLRHSVSIVDLSTLVISHGAEDSFDALTEHALRSVTERRLPATPAVLIGFGLGAAVALSITLRDAHQGDGLVLVGGWLNAPPAMQQLVSQTLEIASHDAALADRSFAQHLVSAQDWRDIPASPVHRDLLALGATLNLGGDALSITNPTLVVGCTFDEFATVDQSQLLYGAIPAARYVEIPTGHDVAQVRPGELFSVIEVFLAEHHDFAPGAVLRRSTP